jgi:hypothetical protein
VIGDWWRSETLERCLACEAVVNKAEGASGVSLAALCDLEAPVAG